jgi:hypothetical protein
MKIEQDKWRHFYVGIAMGLILQLPALLFLPFSWIWAGIIVLFLVVAASYGFELISLVSGKGYYDLKDAVAGVLGGILGMALAFLVKLFI